ncbi:VOC family protein [Thermobifida halotolerans]|uniref:VOC family protein n=1 Tax=Thermobifida halotolerans TaxID=483545 RepID=A0AA97M6H3_9ACTN|nr:VOC family protein [Thermobifida halotolerans]UOE22112.1 VOC family protein [Thermobifida halotolerans]
MQLELRQVPDVLPFEAAGEERLYRPEPGWWGPGKHGVPGARGVLQAGYTVADLAEAVAFHVNVLGGEVLYRESLRFDADYASRQFAIDQAVEVETAVVRLGPVTNVELAQYTVSDQRTERPRNSDVGGHHLAFFVDDVDAAVAWLRTVPGVEVLGEPQLIQDGGPIHGDYWVYFKAPSGFQMEVLNMPDGMPYERFTDARRFGPSDSWENR